MTFWKRKVTFGENIDGWMMMTKLGFQGLAVVVIKCACVCGDVGYKNKNLSDLNCVGS